jgi:non-ribosomal peptide synthetase component F
MKIDLPTITALSAEEAYAERIAAGKKLYAPEGDALSISPAVREQTLMHRWERMVEVYGTRPALDEAERTLSYTEVNQLANRIAHALLAHHLPRELPVALRDLSLGEWSAEYVGALAMPGSSALAPVTVFDAVWPL